MSKSIKKQVHDFTQGFLTRSVSIGITQSHQVRNDALAHWLAHALEQSPHFVFLELTRAIGVDHLKLLAQVFVIVRNRALALKCVKDLLQQQLLSISHLSTSHWCETSTHLLPFDAEVQFRVGFQSGFLEEFVESDGSVNSFEDLEDRRPFFH